MATRKTKVLTITPATHETPAMSASGGSEKERRHLSTPEFRQQLALLAADVKSLTRMARKVGKTGKVTLDDGTEFGSKQLNELVNRHNKTLRTLASNYSAGVKRKRVVSSGRKGDGFSKGVFLRQPLLDFLNSANLGTLKDGRQVREVIGDLLERGLLSRGILTQLLSFYVAANGLRFEESESVTKDGKTKTVTKKYFRAGPEMERHLGPYLSQLEASDRAKTDEQRRSKKTGRVAPRFDRNRFIFSSLQRIANPGVLDKSELAADQASYIEDAGTKTYLKDVEETLKAGKA